MTLTEHQIALNISQQLSAARISQRTEGAVGQEDDENRRLFRLVARLPRFLRIWLFRWSMADAFRIKARSGTTLVTSVGKFAPLPGAAFTFSTGPRAASFVVGAAVEKAWVYRGHLAVRQVLSLSITLNHDLLDGGEAARFASDLTTLLESGSAEPRSP